MTLESANFYEEYYIDLFNSTNDNYGYNIKLGGLNSEMSEESKNIISNKAKQRYKDKTKNPMYNKKHSEESLNKMSECKTGSKNPMHNTSWNENQRNAKRNGWCYEWDEKRRSEAGERLRKLVSKKVECIEDNLQFDTVSEASNFYKVNVSTLSGHLHNYQKTCGGKHFKFI